MHKKSTITNSYTKVTPTGVKGIITKVSFTSDEDLSNMYKELGIYHYK